MQNTKTTLEHKRDILLQQLASLQPFRRGTVSTNYRQCGKPTCRCAQSEEYRHGPQYLWNATIGGKSFAINLRTEQEVKKYQEETERHKQFVEICQKLVEINEQLCQLPSPSLCEETDEALKKKLRKKLPA